MKIFKEEFPLASISQEPEHTIKIVCGDDHTVIQKLELGSNIAKFQDVQARVNGKTKFKLEFYDSQEEAMEKFSVEDLEWCVVDKIDTTKTQKNPIYTISFSTANDGFFARNYIITTDNKDIVEKFYFGQHLVGNGGF